MRLPCVFELIGVADANLDFAGCDPAQDGAGASLKLFARGNMMCQARPRQDQRSLLRQLDRINRRFVSAGATKQHQVSSRTQNLEILVEGAFAYAVIHDMYTLPVAPPFGFVLQALVRV